MSEGMELNDRISAPLSCTECRQVVRVNIDRHATGNLTIVCPNCGHEHYRYVENGVITEDRWRSSAPMVSIAYYSTSASTDTMTWTGTSTDSTGSTATSAFLRDAWYNTDSSTNGGW
jgi:predicted  nucleic acid-binding Zn-ribbon protein